MLDRYLHPPLKPALARLAAGLDRRGVRADHLTLFGFTIGALAVPLLMWQQHGAALAAVLINRLCDGLDGALARRQGLSDAGGSWISPSTFCFMPCCRWGLCWPIRRRMRCPVPGCCAPLSVPAAAFWPLPRWRKSTVYRRWPIRINPSTTWGADGGYGDHPAVYRVLPVAVPVCAAGLAVWGAVLVYHPDAGVGRVSHPAPGGAG